MKKNLEKELKKNLTTLLTMQLALESYLDDTKRNEKIIAETNRELGEFRNNRATSSIEEQIKESNLIIDKYNQVLDLIGRDNFIFYPDGDINYIWRESKSNE